MKKYFKIALTITLFFLAVNFVSANYSELVPVFQPVIEKEICNVNVNGSFIGIPFSLSIPFNEIAIGNLSCDKISIWKYFLRFKGEEGIYSITGIRAYPFIWLVIIFLILWIIKKIKK